MKNIARFSKKEINTHQEPPPLVIFSIKVTEVHHSDRKGRMMQFIFLVDGVEEASSLPRFIDKDIDDRFHDGDIWNCVFVK